VTPGVQGPCPLLQVFDMSTSISFYREALGFEVAMHSQPGPDYDWVLLRNGGGELMLNTMYERDERPAAPDPARVAAHDDTALYFGCRDLDAASSRFKALGLAVKGPVDRHYGMRQLSITDPDGYQICLQWPTN